MIDRRGFLQLFGFAGLAALTSQIGLRDDDPNVLLILVDSLNDWLSCLGGHPDARTPHIDQLASQGILFNNAHCATSNSNGSRTSLFTGLAPAESGIYGGDTPYRQLYPRLSTLQQRLMAARYRSQGAGRLFHVNDLYSWQENPFFEFNSRFVSQSLTGINSGPNFDWGVIDVPATDLHDYRVTDWAVRKLQNLEGPFFLGVGLSSTRHPWYFPADIFNRYDPRRVSLPDERHALLPEAGDNIIRFNNRHRLVLEQDLWGAGVAAYLAGASFVDDCVGRLLATLENSPSAENTLVILASTHGMHLGDKGYWLFDTLWEQGTRIPLIVRLPHHSATAGQVCDRAVSLLDIYPTLMDVFQYQALHTLSGRSLKPLLENPKLEWDYPVVISNSQAEFAVRANRWRYIRYRDGGEELYETLGDSRELLNLADDPAYQLTKRDLMAWLPANPEAPQA